MLKSFIKYLIKFLIVVAIYFITAKLGLRLGAVSGFAALVWAPTGISLAVLLLFGINLWPAIFLAAFLVNLTTGAPVPIALGMGAGNVLEAIIGTILFKRFIKIEAFLDNVRDVFVLVFLIGFVSTAVSATIGVTSLYLGGLVSFSKLVPTWSAWWTGDMLGNLIVFPIILTWSSFSLPAFKPKKTLELFTLLATIFFANLFIFFRLFINHILIAPKLYFLFPILLWPALRFGKKVVTAVIVLTALIAIYATAIGIGPFSVAGASLSTNLTNLQTFLAVMSIMILSLSAVVSELNKSKEFLDKKVQEKTIALEASQKDVLGKMNTKNQDLEDNKKATFNLLEDLEIEKAKDDAMLVSIGEGLVAVDNVGRITLVNKAFEKMLGWKETEIHGKVLVEIIPMINENGKSMSELERPINLVLKKNATTTTTSSVYHYIRKDRTQFPVAITVTPIIISGKTIGAVEVFRDITHETEIDKAKSEFVSLASHQLRTPLGIVKWYLEALGENNYFKKSPLEVRKYFDEITKSNERVLSLVRDLLSVSRIDQGRVKDLPKSISIPVVVKEVVEEMQILAHKKEIILNLVVQNQEMPLINIDVLRFHEVIENLITNAIEYTKSHGSVDVLVKPESDMFLISITDTGIGMSTKDQKRLFTKFFRAENATASNPEGSGLGLYVVKSYIEGWGGKITVQSVEGKGSTFTISLPVRAIGPEEGEVK